MPSPPPSSSTTPAPSTSTSLRTVAPSDGSRTLVVAQPEHDRGGSRDGSPTPSGSLRLHGGPRSRPRVVWDAAVVDNEHMGKKKSKICCIYHKPKAFDESSDESSSSGSDSDVDSASSDDGRARPSQRSRHHRRCSHGSHDHDHTSPSSDAGPSTDSPDITVTRHHHHHHSHHRPPSDSNAYESQPSIKGKGPANGN